MNSKFEEIKLRESRNGYESNNSSNSSSSVAIDELIKSEAKFVESLEIIINDFLRKLMPILNKRNRKILSLNIEVLYELHKAILAKLNEAKTIGIDQEKLVCKLFEIFKEQLMEEYASYIVGMKKTFKKVEELCKKHEFRQRLENCRSNSPMGTYLFSDLIKHVSRRPYEYSAFMQKLLNETRENHPSRALIKSTWISMDDLANYLIQTKKDSLNMDDIKQLSSKLWFTKIHGANASGYGHFIRKFIVSSVIKLKDGKSETTKDCTLFLFETAIFICKSQINKYYTTEVLLLNEFKNGEFEPNNGFEFYLYNIYRNNVYVIYFKRQEQKLDWNILITEFIRKLQVARHKTHRLVLWNFSNNLTYCSLCEKVLYGIFYQGYRCLKCSCIAHIDCIAKLEDCPNWNSSTENIIV